MTGELDEVAMQIILHAGDGRSEVKAAYAALARLDYGAAQEALDRARELIQKAHQAQTEVIQAEARGERQTMTMLFSHAQDTLMTVRSESITAAQLITVVRALAEVAQRGAVPDVAGSEVAS